VSGTVLQNGRACDGNNIICFHYTSKHREGMLKKLFLDAKSQAFKT
jgi:hypothetical protein